MILKSDLIDLIFERRNKAYGAYELRKLYSKHLLIAISGPVLILIALLYIVRLPGNTIMQLVKPVFADTTTLVIQPPPTAPIPPASGGRRGIKTVSTVLAIPIVVPDHLATDLPLVAELTGTIEGTSIDGPAEELSSGGVAERPSPIEVPIEPAVLETAEQMPEFPGGMQALSRFMSRNLKVPDEVDGPGTRRRIQVNFIVSKSGSLESVNLNDTIPIAYQKEIRRVFAKMPKWNAGSQHGRSVSVFYHIPIIFEIPEE